MTLEAWVNPAALGSVWRCVVLKEQTGGLIYALYAQTDTNRPSGHVFIASEFDTRGTAHPAAERLDAPGGDLRRHDAADVRQRRRRRAARR